MSRDIMFLMLLLLYTAACADSASESECDGYLSAVKEQSGCEVGASEECDFARANPEIAFDWRFYINADNGLDGNGEPLVLSQEEQDSRFRCVMAELDALGLSYEEKWDSHRLDISATFEQIEPILQWAVLDGPSVFCTDEELCDCSKRSVADCEANYLCSLFSGARINSADSCLEEAENIGCKDATLCDDMILATGPDGDCWLVYAACSELPQGYSEGGAACDGFEATSAPADCD